MVLLPRLRVFCAGACLALSACRRDVPEVDGHQGNVRAVERDGRPVALDAAFFGEAMRALRPYATEGDSVLEVRATGKRVVLQVRVARTPTVAEYAYDGRVIGPRPTHVAGEGELEPNLFDLGAVDLEAIARLFPAAREAVDPSDGVVSEVVLRRSLPFDRNVRARIYVSSPRLAGHLDADAKGGVLTPTAPPH